MGRFFEKLFSLAITHDYYVSGKSEDFVIVPTPDTVKRAKGLRCILKSQPSGRNKIGTASLTAIFEAVDGPPTSTPLLPITSDETFRFVMKLGNDGFLNFTNLPAKASNAEVFYYTNDPGPVLSQQLIELRPKVFLYAFNFGGAVTQLKVENPAGQYLTELTVPLSGGPDYEVPLDLTNYPSGKYKLELFNGVTSVGSKEIYFDNELRAGGIFGIVEIIKNDNTPESFTIDYSGKENFWKYFVVVRSGVDLGDYFIDDNGVGPVTFTATALTGDDLLVANTLKASIPGSAVVLFVAEDPILASEVKRKEMQLFKTDSPNPDVLLINNLPNPSVRQVKPEVYVYI